MFNDKKLLNASFISSLVILICVWIAFEIDGTGTLVAKLSLFVLFGFSAVAYFCGVIFINFSLQNYMTIQAQAERNNKLQDDVLRDQMTGLYNHSAFVGELNRMIEHANANVPFCLAMIDIDDFKKINDTYGHDFGDEVLIYLAQELCRQCEAGDVPYRYGGEEFAVLFSGKEVGEACSSLERLLETVREHRFSFTDKPITFSAGVSGYCSGMTDNLFFESADQALYAAKKAGKNRISTTK